MVNRAVFDPPFHPLRQAIPAYDLVATLGLCGTRPRSQLEKQVHKQRVEFDKAFVSGVARFGRVPQTLGTAGFEVLNAVMLAESVLPWTFGIGR